MRQMRQSAQGVSNSFHHGGWSREEQQEINRIRAACRQHAYLDLATGRTDEGDPWCVVHDRKRNQVVMHIARIGFRYIIACPSRSGLRTTATAQSAANVVLRVVARKTKGARSAG